MKLLARPSARSKGGGRRTGYGAAGPKPLCVINAGALFSSGYMQPGFA